MWTKTKSAIILLLIITNIFTLYVAVKYSDTLKALYHEIKGLRKLHQTQVNFHQLSDQEIYNQIKMNDNNIQSLYQMTKDISEVFQIANIKYFMDGGTLLGAVRHGSIIPWDDDIDLVIFDKDERLLNNLKPIFHQLGYDIIEYNGIYKIFVPYSSSVVNADGYEKFFYPFVDIFIMTANHSTGIIEYYKMLNKKMFPKEHYYIKETLPLKEYDFGPIRLFGPKNPQIYLDHYYGTKWNKEVFVHPPHFNNMHGGGYFAKEFKPPFNETILPKHPLIDRVYVLKRRILDIVTNMSVQ